MEFVDLWQLLQLKALMVRHGGSSASSYLADPTSPIASHCAVIIMLNSVPVHQLLWLALKGLIAPLMVFEEKQLHPLHPPSFPVIAKRISDPAWSSLDHQSSKLQF